MCIRVRSIFVASLYGASKYYASKYLDFSPLLEVETYTWEVLPGSGRPDLVNGLTGELNATAALLAELSGSGPGAVSDPGP